MAVYTRLNRKDIEAFLAQYNVGELLSFKGIAEGIENTNYLVILRRASGRAQDLLKGPVLTPYGVPQDDKKFILTLFEKRVDPADLPFFIGFTEWLAARGIVCPRTIAGKDGQRVRPLKGRPAALIEFLEGRGSPHITPQHMQLTGDLVARMHVAAAGFALSRRNALSLEGWHALFTRFRARADAIMPGLEKLMADELDFLQKHWPKNLPSGVIHADIFPDNVFFIDGNTDQPELSGIIDFYFACRDFLAYDLVICLNAWCFDTGHKFVPARAQALLAAYQKLRRLADNERQAMPILARGAAMRFLVTRAHDWLNRPEDALVNPKDPMEYVAKLRFHQQDDRITGLLDD